MIVAAQPYLAAGLDRYARAAARWSVLPIKRILGRPESCERFFHYREGGKQRTLYVGKTDNPEAKVDEKLGKE